MEFPRYIESCFLSPITTIANIQRGVASAIEEELAAVTVAPILVRHAKQALGANRVKLGSVIGFPYGYAAIESKVAEIVLATVDGVDELNVVANTTALKNEDWQYLAKELTTILAVVKKAGKSLAIILEAGYLSTTEIIKCCDLYGAAGIDFIQIGTGTLDIPASREIVLTVRKHLADAVHIKMASETVPANLNAFVSAGVTRIVMPGKLLY